MRTVSNILDEIENCGLKVTFNLEKFLHPLKPDFPENGVSLIEAVGEKKTPVVNINASEGVKHAIILADYDSKVRSETQTLTIVDFFYFRTTNLFWKIQKLHQIVIVAIHIREIVIINSLYVENWRLRKVSETSILLHQINSRKVKGGWSKKIKLDGLKSNQTVIHIESMSTRFLVKKIEN